MFTATQEKSWEFTMGKRDQECPPAFRPDTITRLTLVMLTFFWSLFLGYPKMSGVNTMTSKSVQSLSSSSGH